MMFDIALTVLYVGCGLFALYRGNRVFFVVLAVLLAVIFQYALDFSTLGKTIVAGIFVFYFLFARSIGRRATADALMKENVDADFKDSENTNRSSDSGGSAENSSSKQSQDKKTDESVEAVLQEFQEHTNRQSQSSKQKAGM